MRADRLSFLGIRFDTLPFAEVVARLKLVTGDRPYGYVVTPNVDHVIRLAENGRDLAPLYEQADLCLCDSRIIRALARRRRLELPVVAGSDLTVAMFRQVIGPGDRVAVVGGDGELLSRLQSLHPGVVFVQHCPPMGLAADPVARRAAAEFVAAQGARFSFICVGSPQQEMIAAAVRSYPAARGLALCVGASLDFLTGRRHRAPLLMRRLGLEWLHRLALEPARMWRRYLVEGPRIFRLAWRWQPPR